MSDDGREDRRRHVPRVIRNAIPSWRDECPAGYCPALGVEMAGAHSWAPYDAVAAALRSLALHGLGEHATRDAARATLRDLFQHPAPFDEDARFPAREVYLSLDHGAFGQCVYRILAELPRVEAAAAAHGQPQMVDAGEAFVKAVAAAAAMLTRAEEEPGKPVLYDRDVFEEAFGLIWRDEPRARTKW